MIDINGILVVDKPQGWTSHDVVQKTRNLLGGVKVGHTGTLDPNATGVLVLLIGAATKSAYLFADDRKRYRAEITFGLATDTHDCDGVTTATGNPEKVDRKNLAEIIAGFTGESEQIPPMYSAVKVNGKKLYQIARKGETVERKPRTINIESIQTDMSLYPKIVLDIVCSKGTYIRVIAHQIGEKSGCPSHLSALKRIASGRYTIDDAVDFLAITQFHGRDEILRLVRPVPLMPKIP
ncbi:tRNA pseudouridine(55) synthase TruB [bacterium]|nr:tRNA pseudouridine(55) synthase TruB [bacterium]